MIETIRIDVDDAQAQRAYDGLEQSQRDLQKATEDSAAAMRDVAEQLRRAESRMDGAGKAAGGAERNVKKLNASLLNLDAALGLAEKGVNLLRRGFDALQRPIDLATGFEAGVAQIRTLGQTLASDFDEQLMKLAADLPQTAGDLTRATYDAISAGIRPEGVIEFIRATSDAAVAGGAGLTESVRTLTTAVNAFPELAGDASRAADILFATVRAGVTDFQQLASTDLAASLGTQGVQLREVGALLAELTKRGQTTSQALTSITAAVKAISKPAGNAAKVFKSLGVETGAAALQSKGLTGILRELNAAADGNVAIIGRLSDRQEATNALLPLLTGGFAAYEETLRTVSTTQGATAESAAIMANTTQGAMMRFRSLTEGVLTRLGRDLLPVINRLLTDLSSWLQANGDEFSRVIVSAVEALVSMGRFVASNGAEIVSFLASVFVADKVRSWSRAISEATGALTGLGAAGSRIGDTLSTQIFDSGKLGKAFGAALRSPAFIGLAVAAAQYIGSIVGNSLGKALSSDIEARGEDYRRQTEAIDAATLATLQKQGAAVSTMAEAAQVMRDVEAGTRFGAEGSYSTPAELLAKAMKAGAGRDEALVALSTLVEQDVARRDKQIAAIQTEIKRQEVAARYQLDSAASVGAQVGARISDIEASARRAEGKRLTGIVDRLKEQARRMTDARTALLKAASEAETPTPTGGRSRPPGSGAGTGASKRAAELEHEARVALAVAEAYSKAEADLIRFDAATVKALADARKAGADVALVAQARATERVSLVAALQDETSAAFAKLSDDADKFALTFETVGMRLTSTFGEIGNGVDSMRTRLTGALTAPDVPAMSDPLSAGGLDLGEGLAAFGESARETTAVYDAFMDATREKSNATFSAAAADVAAYSASIAAAFSSASTIADAFGASAAALATIKIAENIAGATEQTALALAAGAVGNVPGAIGHGAAAAQHTAAAIKWGVDALGGSGGGSAPVARGGAGGGAASRTPRTSSLPREPRTQPTPINVTINGVVATDRQASHTLGASMAQSVARQLQRATGRRGLMQLPATAGARF